MSGADDLLQLFDLGLLLFDGIDQDGADLRVFDAFDLAFLVAEGEQGFDLGDFLRDQAQIVFVAAFPIEGDGAPDALVDVVLGMPNAERVQRLRLVPVPLYLGLFGWRVLVVRKGQASAGAGCAACKTCAPCSCCRAATGPTPRSCAATACR